jgi:hypothetical protein
MVPAASEAAAPLSLGKAALIALGTALLVLAVGLWWTRRQVSLTEVPVAEPRSATASASVSAPPSASTPAASATASAAASATATAATDEDARDGSELAPGLGLLKVTFTGPPDPDAVVYQYSKPLGPVGKKIEVPCGQLFLRVGKAPGPSWLSKGAGVVVRCRAVNELTLAP